MKPWLAILVLLLMKHTNGKPAWFLIETEDSEEKAYTPEERPYMPEEETPCSPGY